MYKSKKNWVVAPVVLLTLLGAVAPAPIALTNVVNAEGETPATTTTSSSETTTTDSGATPEKDNTVAPVEATIAAKKDAIFAIQNLELPKSLTATEKEKTHAKNVKFKTQDDFIASINAIADSADTQSVFDVLKSAYT